MKNRKLVFENEKVKMYKPEKQDSKLLTDPNFVQIPYPNGVMGFLPDMTWKDHAGDDVLYFKFKHKENLVLYLETGHPESRRASDGLKLSIQMANFDAGKNYAVVDFKEYTDECYRAMKEMNNRKEKKEKIKRGRKK